MTDNKLTKEEIQNIDDVWHARSPVHEINADTNEDMFWGTMRICMSEYAQQEAVEFNKWCMIHCELKDLGGGSFYVYKNNNYDFNNGIEHLYQLFKNRT